VNSLVGVLSQEKNGEERFASRGQAGVYGGSRGLKTQRNRELVFTGKSRAGSLDTLGDRMGAKRVGKRRNVRKIRQGQGKEGERLEWQSHPPIYFSRGEPEEVVKEQMGNGPALHGARTPRPSLP